MKGVCDTRYRWKRVIEQTGTTTLEAEKNLAKADYPYTCAARWCVASGRNEVCALRLVPRHAECYLTREFDKFSQRRPRHPPGEFNAGMLMTRIARGIAVKRRRR